MRDQEWLMERIWDVMNYKNISTNKLCPLVGLKYPMELHRYLDGTNYITPQMLSDIASGLGVSVERLEQTDSNELLEEVNLYVEKGKYTDHVIKEANKLVELSIGVKEKVVALRNLGWLYYHSNNLDGTRAQWERAYKLLCKKGKRKKESVIDGDLLFRTIIDLSVYLIENKEFESALKLLSDSQLQFTGDSDKLGMIHQNRGLCLSKLGDNDSAKEHYLISHECYRLSGNNVNLGRIQNNISELYFFEDDLNNSKEFAIRARENLKNDHVYARCVLDRNLARIEMNLGNFNAAQELVDQWLCLQKDDLYSLKEEAIGKVLLMKSDITRDPKFAEEIFTYSEVSRELRCNAADVLVTIYLDTGDADKALKYYRVVKETTLHGVEDYKKGDWY